MKKNDLQELAELYTLVYQRVDIVERKIQKRWSIDTSKKLLSHLFDKQSDLAFVAETNGQIVGAFLAGIKPWWDGNHLFDGEIFVHPDHQRRGVGTALCKTLYKKALEKYSVTDFDAYTYKKTKFPLSWYLSNGFMVSDDWAMISGKVKSVLDKMQEK